MSDTNTTAPANNGTPATPDVDTGTPAQLPPVTRKTGNGKTKPRARKSATPFTVDAWATARLKVTKCPLKVHGATVQLLGLPSAYNTDGVVELVMDQQTDEIKVKLAKRDINELTEARPQGVAERDAVVELVLGEWMAGTPEADSAE